MPWSSAASTTRAVCLASVRIPKLLHPRPTTDTSRLPMRRVSIRLSPFSVVPGWSDRVQRVEDLGDVVRDVGDGPDAPDDVVLVEQERHALRKGAELLEAGQGNVDPELLADQRVL